MKRFQAPYASGIVVAGTILTAPLLLFGIPRESADGVLHALWYSNFAAQWWAGEVYPRWLLDLNGGLGSPVFFYYGPVPYYLTAILRPLFPADPHGWHQLGVAASLALTASGLCAYLWLKDITDRPSATVAAILYMALPYHLAFDLYSRGGFAQNFGFIWMPVMLYFTNGISRGREAAVIGVAVSFALLVMTHPPTALMFAAVPPCYALMIPDGRGAKVRTLALTLLGMVLGVALCSVYLLPALLTQRVVAISDMTTGFYSYSHSFLFTQLRWHGGYGALTVMFLTLWTLAAACCVWVITRSCHSQRLRKERGFWGAIGLVSVALMTPLSDPIWRVVPMLRQVQFPWRFNGVFAVAATGLLALGVSSIKARRPGPTRVMRAMIGLLALSWVLFTAKAIWEAFPEVSPSADKISRRVRQARDAPEYRPKWTPSLREADLERLLLQVGKSGDGLAKVRVVGGAATVVVDLWEPRRIGLRVDTRSGALLDISQLYYPGWAAELVGRGTDLEVKPSVPDGLVRVRAPPGTHRVLLRLASSAPESAGKRITALAGALTLVLFLWLRAGRRRRHPS